MSLKCNFTFLFSIIVLFAGTCSFAQNSTIPGSLTSPYPTIHNLALEWIIQGDDNQNGVVRLNYREKGEKVWHEGMPLRRVPAGNSRGTTPVFSWENKHSGSVFDLKPGTIYELHVSLEDPDGGSEARIVEAQTRQIPAYDERAEIIEIAPGTYDTLVCRGGTEAKPIVYRCSAGTATFVHIDLQYRDWVFIEGFKVDNPHKNGFGIRFDGARNCVIRSCTVNAVYGIVAYKPGAENCYISDNVITGTCSWTDEAMGAHGANIGEGIEITGPGNVICYNRVSGFRDCISTMEDRHVVDQTCIDIYNNDVYNGVDDAIEADFCFSNCRIYRNRITNSFVGLSSQPSLGGPTYFFRNVLYNVVHAAFKLKRNSHGDVVLHNTVVKVGAGLAGNDSMDYAFFRNNLAIGGPTGGVIWGDYGAGNPWAADIIGPRSHCSFDHDAVGVFEVPYIARIGGLPFSEVEKNGIEGITMDETFRDVAFPNPPVPEREVQDLRPRAGSGVIDAGIFIPNMNEDFIGNAPDCGAYEAEQDLPHYGPRYLDKQPENK